MGWRVGRTMELPASVLEAIRRTTKAAIGLADQ